MTATEPPDGIPARRDPTTRRGVKTRDELIDAATAAFARLGFHATSVAMICREASVANGSFYQYFPDKRAVFDAIVVRARDAIRAAVDSPGSVRAVLLALIGTLGTRGREYQVFREAEFLVDRDAAMAFYEPIVARLEGGFGLDEAVAWALIGAWTFVSLRYVVWPGAVPDESVVRSFLDVGLEGLAAGRCDRWNDLSLPARPTRAGPIGVPTRGRAAATRRALLGAARRRFAGDGYAAARISQITADAGVALGTFYVHFASKREVLAALVEEIRFDMTTRVLAASVDRPDRIERERRNLLVFLQALAEGGELYRIVREAEFAEPEIGRGYYEAIARGYAGLLAEAQVRGEIRPGDPEVQAWALMGAAHATGMRWVLWRDGKQAPPARVRAVLRWQMIGIPGI